MKGFKEVSQSEFEAFLAAYPRALVRGVSHIFDPPFVTYNDFTIAEKWPESVIASFRAEDPPAGFRIKEQP